MLDACFRLTTWREGVSWSCLRRRHVDCKAHDLERVGGWGVVVIFLVVFLRSGTIRGGVGGVVVIFYFVFLPGGGISELHMEFHRHHTGLFGRFRLFQGSRGGPVSCGYF